MDLWLFYPKGYNLILSLYILLLKLFQFWPLGDTLGWLLCPLWLKFLLLVGISIYFLHQSIFPYTFCTKDIPALPCISSAPVLKLVTSPRILVSFYWERYFGSWTVCIHCFWGLMLHAVPSRKYVCVYINICVCIYVY